MKKILLLPLLLFALQLGAQTLFTYGKNPVSRQEFISAYEKNKKLSDKDPNALKEYLQLYINFKLKVQDARDHGLDTLPALQADLQSFKNQIENNYIYDKVRLQQLLDEALTRSKKDIHVTALYIRASDSLKAKREAIELGARLTKGKQPDLNALAKEGTQVTKEDFGYITVFTLPYDIENIIYSLKPSQYSRPYYFQDGYYVFRNEAERPAAGKIKLAQVLIASDPGDASSLRNAKSLADSLYNLIQKGGDFAELAKEYSNDRSTFMNGGEMQEISVGKYSPEFEKHAFALKQDGEVAPPFKTSFGYHILKRVSASPVPQQPNEEFRYVVKQQLLQDERVASAKEQLLQTAIRKTGFISKAIDTSDLYRVTDTSLISTKNISSGKVNQKTVLFSFNDGSSVTVQDWDQYIRGSGRIIGGKLHESYTTIWPDFRKHGILVNYKKRLGTFDPEFAEQIREFSDGNMLFEMMQRKVWMKASNDSAGLEKYYDDHQSQYVWKKSADAIIFSCSNEATAEECLNALGQMSWREVMKRFSSVVQADSGRFEYSQLPLTQGTVSVGMHNPVVNRFDGTTSFVKVLKMYPENIQRSFSEARGLVIEDYQNLLERKWVDQLKKKYPVVVNSSVWDSVRKNYQTN